ncbi:MAG: hypothetical protein ACI8QZ_000415 [Chlamydiales bacterium]|jgi:hypothetical protein
MAKEPKLNAALAQEVRRWARSTTPEDLKKRGIQRVRSIKLADMADLIEKAVNRTLMARTIGELDDDLEGISGEARSEFLRLVADDREKRSSGLEQKAEGELERLKSELARRRKALERQELELGADKRMVKVEDQIRRLFSNWGGGVGDNSQLEQQVIDLALREMTQEHRQVQVVRLQQHREEIDRLERRIGKLSNILGQTEEELARMVKGGMVVDEGVASIYRDFQGLKTADTGFTKKSDLMREIFEANVAFRSA